jgi:hypothetical protein
LAAPPRGNPWIRRGLGGEFGDRFRGAEGRAPGDNVERRPGGDGGLPGDAGRGLSGAGARGGSDAAQITSWVEAHFTAKTVGGTTVYDLTTPSAGS